MKCKIDHPERPKLIPTCLIQTLAIQERCTSVRYSRRKGTAPPISLPHKDLVVSTAPLYAELEQEEPNESISFGTFEGRVGLDNRLTEAEISLALRLLPEPGVVFEAAVTGEMDEVVRDVLRAKPQGTPRLLVPSRYLDTAFLRTGVSLFDPVKIRGTLPFKPSGFPSSVTCNSIRFCLINFQDFICQLPPEEGQPRRFRTEMNLYGDCWHVSLNQQVHAQAIFKGLRENGGFGITHVGEIRKSGCEIFEVAEAELLLDALHHFFSFVRGFWCGPTLPTAISSVGEILWESWSVVLPVRWRGVQSWWDRHNGQLAEAVFPGFWRRWNEPAWREPLQRAIYWYLGSNLGSSGVEGSTVLSQAGLESLAWLWFVEHRSALSPDGFERLTAADRIRLLLSEAKIPLEIPDSLGDLKTYARANSLRDGPEAITAFRNGYVHPGRKASKVIQSPADARIESWTLGQWYFELLLLFFFGHSGEYRNRTRPRQVGQTEPVPWI